MDTPKIKPGKGKLLISAPYLSDVFKRSVIFLTYHNDNYSIVFILNKPLKYKASELIEDFPDFSAPVFLGGPVQPEMLNFIHKAGDSLDGGIEIGNGIFWGGNYETLKILAESRALDPDDFIFYLGYSGWGAGQLVSELKTDSWIVADSDPNFIFENNSQSLWGDILREMGGEFKIISTFPEDPSVN